MRKQINNGEKTLFAKESSIIPPPIPPLEELSEILARGALRLFLSRTEKKQDKRLKEVDLSLKESLNDLDV